MDEKWDGEWILVAGSSLSSCCVLQYIETCIIGFWKYLCVLVLYEEYFGFQQYQIEIKIDGYLFLPFTKPKTYMVYAI